MRLCRVLPFAFVLVVLGCGGSSSGLGAFLVETVLASASFPTQIRFAPDGRIFFTELRTGSIRIIENGTLLAQPFATVPVATTGEQGLLGLALDPNFATNGYVYVYHTHPSPLRNRVVRFTAAGNLGTDETVIVDDLPVASHHVGGRLGFGQDGKLYVTVGDCEDPSNSQSTSSRAGKLLRYNADGTVPGDNPISGNPLFALGLRNPFGMAFHPVSGTPYLSENGPTCDDELNRIEAGGNYGWRPGYPCGDTDPNFIGPLVRFNPPIAPAGMAFYSGTAFPELQGQLLMGSYVDRALRRVEVDDVAGLVLSSAVIANFGGGVIDVTIGPDGFIYVATTSSIVRLVPR